MYINTYMIFNKTNSIPSSCSVPFFENNIWWNLNLLVESEYASEVYRVRKGYPEKNITKGRKKNKKSFLGIL